VDANEGRRGEGKSEVAHRRLLLTECVENQFVLFRGHYPTRESSDRRSPTLNSPRSSNSRIINTVRPAGETNSSRIAGSGESNIVLVLTREVRSLTEVRIAPRGIRLLESQRNMRHALLTLPCGSASLVLALDGDLVEEGVPVGGRNPGRGGHGGGLFAGTGSVIPPQSVAGVSADGNRKQAK